MKEQSADERRVIARPVELLRQIVAVGVVAVVEMRRAACNVRAC